MKKKEMKLVVILTLVLVCHLTQVYGGSLSRFLIIENKLNYKNDLTIQSQNSEQSSSDSSSLLHRVKRQVVKVRKPPLSLVKQSHSQLHSTDKLMDYPNH